MKKGNTEQSAIRLRFNLVVRFLIINIRIWNIEKVHAKTNIFHTSQGELVDWKYQHVIGSAVLP